MESELVLRPTVAELSFQLYDRSVHPELIERLVSRGFERDGYSLRLDLTPAGHLFEWRWKKITLVEVLANQSQPLPENRQLFTHRIGGERTEHFSPNDRVTYQTCFQVEHLGPVPFCHFQDELRHDGERDGILHLLQPNDRMGLSPLSYIDVQARTGSLLIHSYHTFPDEYAVVKSQTLLEVNLRG